jgi:hypothetical protein
VDTEESDAERALRALTPEQRLELWRRWGSGPSTSRPRRKRLSPKFEAPASRLDPARYRSSASWGAPPVLRASVAGSTLEAGGCALSTCLSVETAVETRRRRSEQAEATRGVGSASTSTRPVLSPSPPPGVGPGTPAAAQGRSESLPGPRLRPSRYPLRPPRSGRGLQALVSGFLRGPGSRRQPQWLAVTVRGRCPCGLRGRGRKLVGGVGRHPVESDRPRLISTHPGGGWYPRPSSSRLGVPSGAMSCRELER